MKQKATVLFFMIVCLLGGCTGSLNKGVSGNNILPIINKETIVEGRNFLKDEDQPIKSNGEAYKILSTTFAQGKVKVEYPQIKGLGSDSHDRAINLLIKNNLFETQIDEQLKEAKNTIERYNVEEDYYLELNYEVTMNTDQLLSILYKGTGSFKTSAFPIAIVHAVTIDIERISVLKLSDFTDINDNLIEKISDSRNVTNSAIEHGMAKESLLTAVKTRIIENKTSIIETLMGNSDGYYNFAIKPDSLLVSIIMDHASGDYALIEVPR